MGKTIELPLPGTRVRVWNAYFDEVGIVKGLGGKAFDAESPQPAFSYHRECQPRHTTRVAYIGQQEWEVLPDPPKTMTITVEVNEDTVKRWAEYRMPPGSVASELVDRFILACREALANA